MKRRRFIGAVLGALNLSLFGRQSPEDRIPYSIEDGPTTFYLPTPVEGRTFSIKNTDGRKVIVVDSKNRYHLLKPNERRMFF